MLWTTFHQVAMATVQLHLFCGLGFAVWLEEEAGGRVHVPMCDATQTHSIEISRQVDRAS